MISRIIAFSVNNKLLVWIFTACIIAFGLYALSNLSIGAVPDITNNQVQVITTSRNLSTQDMEQFVTYPVELEMANIPGVEEIRSVSKFGLSVVTIVFDESMGTYLPRQLIAERLKTAAESIPEGFGSPAMGPITTGLGEIYQYILDVRPGYEDRYDPATLRSIQDWIVKRQLSGIPGVVEINTWGGHLKQYEVALDPSRLQSVNISAAEVLTALESNNSVAGGSYIEREKQAWFIRGDGLVRSLEDIENITVALREDKPVLIRDIAEVRFGKANRFGAITGNGEGEKVLGQVMMLKGAGTKKVIEAVKERIEEVQKSLPEGVYINGFLDRSELIGRTTFTIQENLILGCLIVIFVVVLLLGNLRSGLVIASVIPLSLLFALGMMYLFGIDANLMSLGAIDFGIIIDGAVIIVEFIAFTLVKNAGDFEGVCPAERKKLMDRFAVMGADKMMNAAVFGQIIILIVFIPILSLSGVEGKMFRPMALTFSFALVGAMILCFTYVPVAASLFLKPEKLKAYPFSTAFMSWLENVYEKTLKRAIRRGNVILVSALAIFLVSAFVFTRMGGEFVPTLDEGDFVIQPVLPTGTSLSETIEITTRMEQILKSGFPEVDQVVSRIGAAEVPTDPMSMEESDVIITLKPMDTWTTAQTKDELADAFKEALAVIPGLEMEFTQPIEMRFNELITGVRADIAVKIFGEDLNTLVNLGDQVKAIAVEVPGAADVVVDKIEGLPQMKVEYKRDRLAAYGLSVAELNRLLTMAFAGTTTGVVFEGERRYDLVVRMNTESRQSLSDIEQLYVDLPGGGKVPFRTLANVGFTEGAAKISRDNTRRRTVVGINVRDRDLASVVEDLKTRIEDQVTFPPGYSVSYGGQFENLESAQKRLLIAVPVALLLIFIMLYFAFGTVREALLIYTAIPLASVGGIWFLYLRDMPFSISAGVGFIALFGISVLNGIVLIEHYKSMNRSDFTSIQDLVIQGTRDRLRAILLTASAAALGFLPMALSQNAGAEVQRPLATVVIGGLLTASLLTLIVLPIWYIKLESGAFKREVLKHKLRKGKRAMLWLLFVLPGLSQAQELSLEALIDTAMTKHQGLQAATYRLKSSELREKGSFNLEKTEVYYHYDQNNLAINELPITVFGVTQNFSFPGVYLRQRDVYDAQTNLVRASLDWEKRQLEKQVVQAYYQWVYRTHQIQLLKELDSLYSDFERSARRKFELGESTYLESISARSKRQQLGLRLRTARSEKEVAYEEVLALIQSEERVGLQFIPMTTLDTLYKTPGEHPLLQMTSAAEKVQQEQTSLFRQEYYPDFSVNYFSGTNATLNDQLYGVQLGIRVPLWFSATRSKIRASQMEEEAKSSERLQISRELDLQKERYTIQLKQRQAELRYYQSEGDELANALLRTAKGSYTQGEIDYFQYITLLDQAFEIKLGYLDALHMYNQSVISITYLIPE